jgi:hypothetical protein
MKIKTKYKRRCVCVPVAVQKQTVSAGAWKPFTVCTGFQIADLADFWRIKCCRLQQSACRSFHVWCKYQGRHCTLNLGGRRLQWPTALLRFCWRVLLSAGKFVTLFGNLSCIYRVSRWSESASGSRSLWKPGRLASGCDLGEPEWTDVHGSRSSSSSGNYHLKEHCPLCAASIWRPVWFPWIQEIEWCKHVIMSSFFLQLFVWRAFAYKMKKNSRRNVCSRQSLNILALFRMYAFRPVCILIWWQNASWPVCILASWQNARWPVCILTWWQNARWPVCIFTSWRNAFWPVYKWKLAYGAFSICFMRPEKIM